MSNRKKSGLMVRMDGSAESAGSFGAFKSLSEYTLIPGEMKKEDFEEKPLYTIDHLKNDLMMVRNGNVFVLF